MLNLLFVFLQRSAAPRASPEEQRKEVEVIYNYTLQFRGKLNYLYLTAFVTFQIKQLYKKKIFDKFINHNFIVKD